MNREPAVDQWFDQVNYPLDALEAGRADLEAAVRAWCDWKAGSGRPH